MNAEERRKEREELYRLDAVLREKGWYASVDSKGEYSFPATHWKRLNEL